MRPPTGRHAPWPPPPGTRRRQSAGCGGRSGSNPTGWRASSCRPTPTSWTRSTTSSVCTSNPPERAIVICVDEKTGIQALDRTQPALPMLAGQPRHRQPRLRAPRHRRPLRRPQRGHRRGDTRTDKRHRSIEFRKFLDLVADQVPADVDVHVVLDNASTHKTAGVEKWLKRHPVGSSTSPRPRRRGSTWWSAGSPSSPPRS